MDNDEHKLYTLARWMAGGTILYNLIEGVLATTLGARDETLSLFGFGLDSFIEMISGAGILYMVARTQRHKHHERERFEITALKVTGYSFYALVGVLTAGAIVSLLTAHRPDTTLWGVVISSISILVMLGLIYGKTHVGKRLNSAAMLADAGCTRICVYMSLALLLSSALYEWMGVAYADTVGALGLAWLSWREGRECFEKIRTGMCCAHNNVTPP